MNTMITRPKASTIVETLILQPAHQEQSNHVAFSGDVTAATLRIDPDAPGAPSSKGDLSSNQPMPAPTFEWSGAPEALREWALQQGYPIEEIQAGGLLRARESNTEQILLLIEGAATVAVAPETINPEAIAPAAVTAGTKLIELGPGEPIGALELWTGRNWPIQVTAHRNCTYIRFPAAEFRRLVLHNRELRLATGDSVTGLMRNIRLYELLVDALGAVSSELFALVHAEARWRYLNSGERLFAQDEVIDTLHLVVSGRLRQLYCGLDREKVEVGHIEVGELVGSVFDSAQMPTTSVAVRETVLLDIPPKLRHSLQERFPQATLPFLANSTNREREILTALDRQAVTPTTFAIIPATADVDLAAFVYELSLTMARYGSVRPLTRADVDANYSQNRVADIPRNHPMHSLLLDWLQQLETSHDYVLYIGDATWSEWTQRCIRQADRILIVANAANSPAPSVTEQAIFETAQHADTELVLLHPGDTEYPSGTASWLSPRPVQTHYHVRMHQPSHYARLARRLTGNAIGAVLAGGGARGYAHLGLLKAMEERSIPYDAVGGTSMGALVGAGFALGWNSARSLEKASQFSNRKALFDLTLPLVSLFASDKVTDLVQDQFGGHQIEDLWVPYFAISTNLTASSMTIHDRGPLWFAIRASLSIPAIFSPVVNEDGHLLVDGGVMNNFPVDVMRQRIKGGKIVGMRLPEQKEDEVHYSQELSVSGWQVLRRRLNPAKRAPKVPNLGAILMQSMMVNNQQAMHRADQLCDLLLKPDVGRFGLLQFERYQAIMDAGYQAAVESDLASMMA